MEAALEDVMRAKMVVAALALVAGAACGSWPQTQMVAVGSEQATAMRPVVTAAPAFTAGPDSLRTTTLDGRSNVFVCPGGGIVAARHVPADSVLVC
jgi:hypothetical protein